jgi:hypothetical protein
MIFLGWDTKIDKKGWFVYLDKAGKPAIEWNDDFSISYIKYPAGNPATPEGTQIVYGRFVGKTRQPYYHQEIDAEQLEKFGGYLTEVLEKYKETQKEKSEQK